MTCGARLLYNYIWIGGLSHDLPPNFIEQTKEFVKYFRPRHQNVERFTELQRNLRQADSERGRVAERSCN